MHTTLLVLVVICSVTFGLVLALVIDAFGKSDKNADGCH